jgi:uncharacterized delta-60 repeat protein
MRSNAQFGLEQLERRNLFSSSALDPGFNSGELLSTTFSSGSSAIADIAVLPDGGFLAAGTVHVRDGNKPTDQAKLAIAKYRFDGSLDATFGSDGQIENTPRSMTAGRRLQLTPDGGFIVMGSALNGPNFLLKFTGAGRVDTRFGNNGVLKPQSAGTFTVDPEGRILVGASRPHPVNAQDAVLTRYMADGTLDTSFADSGQFVSVSPVSGEDVNHFQDFNSVAIDEQGRILACMEEFDTGGGDENTDLFAFSFTRVYRLNDHGEVDPTYHGEDVDRLHQMAGVLSDGSIILIGKRISRLDPTGALDTSYGNNGIANTTKIGQLQGTNDRAAVSADGSIVFGNIAAPGSMELTRITAEGQPDLNFGDQGTLTVATNTDVHAEDFLDAVDYAPDGSLVIGGQSGILSPTGRTDTRSFVAGRLIISPSPAVQLVPRTLKESSSYLYITVLIRDPDGVDLTSLDDSDLKLLDADGIGRRFRFFSSADVNGDGKYIAARYRIKGPNNSAWTRAANGTYEVRLQRKQIADINGNVATAQPLGTVRVNIR